jgi:CHAT domain-containing protein/tetratricopeptide (TPR) repeat protein
MQKEPIPEPLATLYRLLGRHGSAEKPEELTLDDFAAWKTRAEELGRSRDGEAGTAAEALVAAAMECGNPHCLAFAHWIAGNVYHNLNAMRSAHDAYGAAYSLYTELGDELNRARMSVGWVNVLTEQGQLDEALDLAQIAEAVLRRSIDPDDEARLAILYGARGITHEFMGHLLAAQHDYERKWIYYRNLPQPSNEERLEGAMALNDLAVASALLGQYPEADRLLRSALEYLQPIANDASARVDAILLLMNRAWVATLRQSPYTAVRRAFAQARAARDTLQDPLDRLFCAHIDLDEANWLIRNGHWNEVDRGGLALLQEQLEQHGIEFESIYAELLLTQWDALAGAAEPALSRLEHLAKISLEKTPILAYLAYLWQARVLRAQGNLSAAKNALHQAIHLIEQARGRLTLDDYRAGYLEDKLVAYHDLVALYLDLQDYRAALAVAERCKARTLSEAAGISAAPAQPAAESQWSLEAIAAHISPGMLAIAYAEVHDDAWAFLVDSGGLIADPVHLGHRLQRADLENGLHKLQRIAGVSNLASLSPAELEQHVAIAQVPLAAWHAAFLAPLQPLLDHYPRLLIAPDGLLNALPFACLYDEEQGRYLVETHTVSFAPSLSLWPTLSGSRPPEANGVLVAGSSALDGRRGTLPAAIEEARAVASLFRNATLLLEEGATFDEFMRRAATSGLIYVAAHGVHHAGDPRESYVELSDRPLRVRDVLTLQLPQSLVVLSACDTGRGQLIGNELMGLVRSFLYAGASSVLSTHWQVHDDVAHQVMTTIMRLLAGGCPLPEAVQQVQQQWIRRESEMTSKGHEPWVHPFFWGALAVTGGNNWQYTEKNP